MKRKRHAPYLRLAFRLIPAACISLILGLAWSSPAQAHVLGGRAFAAFISVPTLGAGPLSVADTGDLAPDGGWNAADLLSTQVPSILSAKTLVAATVGDAMVGKVSSSTSLADVVLLPGHVAELRASFVRAEATTTDAGSRGTSEIYNLRFGGTTVPVTGLPNQKVEIAGLLGPVATLTINEQAATATGIMVNALHLVLATGDEVIVSSATSAADSTSSATSSGETGILPNPLGSPILPLASSDTTCVPEIRRVRTLEFSPFPEGRLPIIRVWANEQKCFDFVTGGGFFFQSSDGPGRVNYGFNAGYKNGDKIPLQVHFNLIDHNTGRHIKVQEPSDPFSYGPSDFFGDPCRCRFFSGPDQFTGATVEVHVCDKAEPGRGVDKIVVFTSDGYVANLDPPHTIDGGNIQLHKACPQEGCANGASTFRGTGNTPQKANI